MVFDLLKTNMIENEKAKGRMENIKREKSDDVAVEQVDSKRIYVCARRKQM